MRIRPFSKDETDILKGIGILLIVFHNFYHNLTPLIGENEFIYRYRIFENFWHTLLDNPLESPRAVLSYFGHYAVQLFIFFSAYGLTRKYYGRTLVYADFMRDRLAKIYLPFLLCVSVYVVLGLLKGAFLTDEKVLYWDSLLWKILLVSNFIPGQALMPVGPWWFLPFIFQFYLLYPALLRLFERHGGKALLAVSAASLVLGWSLEQHDTSRGVNYYCLVFGHLPVLCAGIYLAASKAGMEIKAGYLWLLLGLFILGNFNRYAWEFSRLAFAVLALALAAKAFGGGMARWRLAAPLAFYGSISFPLFMVNGFLRTPFHQIAENHSLWWVDNLTAVASLAFSTACAYALHRFEARVRGYVSVRMAR